MWLRLSGQTIVHHNNNNKQQKQDTESFFSKGKPIVDQNSGQTSGFQGASNSPFILLVASCLRHTAACRLVDILLCVNAHLLLHGTKHIHLAVRLLEALKGALWSINIRQREAKLLIVAAIAAAVECRKRQELKSTQKEREEKYENSESLKRPWSGQQAATQFHFTSK